MEINTYFQPTKDYFWQWEEMGKVIAIPKDQTIAYIGLVKDAIDALHPQGLPPFGALLLAIIATNPNGREGLSAVEKIVGEKYQTVPSDLKEGMDFLYLLSDIPVEYKSGEKRILLFQAIFDRCHNILSLKHSRNINNSLKNAVSGNFAKSEYEDYNMPYRDFRTLQILDKKLPNMQAILDKIAGVETLPQEIVLEETEDLKDVNKDFVDLLIENSKTFHVGTLVKRIWSGLNIPVHSTIPSQQPIGGVSDLTNKGDFDKLLISEFANDDDVFMSRLANNEALFIQREIPPSNNELKRVILIDASLKNWGTPKTIAFATMLAVARHPKTDIECEAFVIGKAHHPVSIENIHGIIDGLEILAGNLNAAEGIESYFTEFPPDANREIFLITEPSTLKQSAMLKMVNEYHAAINYWIYTDAEGNIDVYKKQQNSKKHLQHLRLPLAELWTKKSATKQPASSTNSLQIKIPLLREGSLKIKTMLFTSDGAVFQITSEKTILKFYDRGRKQEPWEYAWEIILEDLPFTSEFAEIGMLSNGEYVLAMYNPHGKFMLILNLNTTMQHTVPVRKWTPYYGIGVVFHEDAFYYHSSGTVCWSIDANGNKKDTAPLDYKIYAARKNELVKLRAEFYSSFSGSFVKKVQRVYINEQNCLCINSHVLLIESGDIRLVHRSTNPKKKAVSQSRSEFRFDDGSTVQIRKSGVIVLKSSNPDLPEIFLPSKADRLLGVVAGNKGAGHAYYLKNELETMPVWVFSAHYIDPFIKTILNHGT